MAENNQTGSTAAPTSSGTESNGSGSGPPTTELATGQHPLTQAPSYREKLDAARAKVEATTPQPDAKAAAAPAAAAAAEAKAQPADDITERTAELARAARNTREEAARLKKEREEAKSERAAAAKERADAGEDLKLAKELKRLRGEGKYAEAWSLAMGDKAHDIDAFTAIAARVADSDRAPTAEDIAKLAEAATESALKKRDDAAKDKAERERAKEREEHEKYERAYFEADGVDAKTGKVNPADLGVIPTYQADVKKWPAIAARGASREYMRRVFAEEARRTGQGPTAVELLSTINGRLQAQIDKEAKAMGYEKPQAKKPPGSVTSRGAPAPTGGKDRSEMSYSEKVAAAKARFREMT